MIPDNTEVFAIGDYSVRAYGRKWGLIRQNDTRRDRAKFSHLGFYESREQAEQAALVLATAARLTGEERPE